MNRRIGAGLLVVCVVVVLSACTSQGGLALPTLSATMVFETAAPTPAIELRPSGSTASQPSLPSDPAPAPSSQPDLLKLDWSATAYVDPQGLETLALVNEWRVGIDLWPLALNEELSGLAQNQADYLASLGDWPENIHLDALGGMSDDRARRIGWPGYDESGQAVAVTEIISTGTSPADAVDWWRTSDIHTWVIEQAYYREAGVGVIEQPWGKTYVIVVGSRPNILPVTVDPLRGDVYLTSERYSGGYNGIIGDIASVQFLPSSASPLDPGLWLPWNLSYTFPDNLPGAVAYSDGAQVIVQPADHMAWLPHTLP